MRRIVRALRLTRTTARWAVVLATRAADAVRRLPPRVALFYVAALGLAIARRDRFTLTSATRPDDLQTLIALAQGSKAVAEIGTGPGWSAIALALLDPERRVVSFDVEPRPAASYARLVPARVRKRISFVLAAGAEGAGDAPDADFVFIDSSHQFEETVATFEAWRPKLRRGGVVVFHDYGNPQYPGVAQAITHLGLSGEASGGVYVWRP